MIAIGANDTIIVIPCRDLRGQSAGDVKAGAWQGHRMLRELNPRFLRGQVLQEQHKHTDEVSGAVATNAVTRNGTQTGRREHRCNTVGAVPIPCAAGDSTRWRALDLAGTSAASGFSMSGNKLQRFCDTHTNNGHGQQKHDLETHMYCALYPSSALLSSLHLTR